MVRKKKYLYIYINIFIRLTKASSPVRQAAATATRPQTRKQTNGTRFNACVINFCKTRYSHRHEFFLIILIVNFQSCNASFVVVN